MRVLRHGLQTVRGINLCVSLRNETDVLYFIFQCKYNDGCDSVRNVLLYLFRLRCKDGIEQLHFYVVSTTNKQTRLAYTHSLQYLKKMLNYVFVKPKMSDYMTCAINNTFKFCMNLIILTCLTYPKGDMSDLLISYLSAIY